MPIEVRVDIAPVSIILNDGSGWQWLPHEIGPSLLEVRDKQSNVVAVFPKDRVVYVRVINDLSQQQELSSNLEKDHHNGIELTKNMEITGKPSGPELGKPGPPERPILW
jgi:hypothetical protein